MLQHNIAKVGQRAHVAHAAMISLHTLCCGLPILALTLVALSGAASGASIFLATSQKLHGILHQHEPWILAISASLVILGGFLEWRTIQSGHRRTLSPLFYVSCACFVLNIVILAVHRGV